MPDLTKQLAEIVNEGAECDPEDAEEAVEKAQDRLQEVSARLAALSPPDSGVGVERRLSEGRGDPYTGAGSAYREAAEAGDAEKLAELEREREGLIAERSLLQRQRSALRGIGRKARERVERETAPYRLADRLAAFPELLDEAEAALEAFRSARDALEEAGAEIIGCRKVIGDDADGLTPAQLRRWGLLATADPGSPTVERFEGPDGRPRQRTHLFRTRSIQRERLKALAPPRDELIEAVRRRVTSERNRRVRYAGDPPEIDARRIMDAVEEVRKKAIISGSFDELEIEAEPVEA